jgi:predicted nucleotidyltransferase
MISRGNPLLTGASGKLRNIIVKQYTDKTVVTAVPDMSGRKLSKKQKESNLRMRMAVQCAKHLLAHPQQKQRACEMLNVPPNRVYHAIVKEYLLTDGNGSIFEYTPEEQQDQKTVTALKKAITADVPDAEVQLFGNRAKGTFNVQSDWDLLILTNSDHPNALKWQLQEKLFNITIQHGARVNILLVQKIKWITEPDYRVIRERIADELVEVK